MAKVRKLKPPVIEKRAPRIPAAGKPAAETEDVPNALEHDQIARLAYSYWEARGGIAGSPEEDWFRAIQELRSCAARPKP